MIPIYSIYTPSHRVLKEQFFEPTVPQDLELHLDYFENDGAGFIKDPSWCRAIIRKVELIRRAIEANWGRIFIYCDVDVQFFGSLAELVHKATAQHDIVFQIDAPGPALCAGFFFCRACDATRALWQQVYERVQATAGKEGDQVFVRSLVRAIPNLRWGHLPPVILGGGTFTGKLWQPGQELAVTHGVLAHHANFTLGVENKVRQCEEVRKQIAAQNFLPYPTACAQLGKHLRFDYA